MTAARRPWAADLLHFWFHELAPGNWFQPSASVDTKLRRRYAGLWSGLRHRSASSFLTDAPTARAAVLLFDQVPRNIHRGTALAFASDRLALEIARRALVRGWDHGLAVAERQFLAMPLMHSEDIATQRASVAYFAALGDATILRFARAHCRMIARFGRFPHRNEILGRRTTDRESAAIAAGFAW